MRHFAILAAAHLVPLAPRTAATSAAQAPLMPWDPTLQAITDYLTGPALHTIAALAFIAAAIGYALGGKLDGGVGRLLRMGAGIVLALHAVQIVNLLFGQ
jgi:type IV secretory pathway VirB2 component (pilin)